MAATYTRDPSSVLDYKVDWTAWLATDTITTSTWTVPTGITKNNDTHDTTTTTIWVSGGTTGETYKLTNHITTAGGRTDERSINISIRER